MTRRREGLAATGGLAVAAAATTWAALLSWRGFSEVPARYLGPLFVLGLTVAGIGAAARSWRLPAVTVIGTQLLVTGMLASWMLSGSPLPVGSAWDRLVLVFSQAFTTAQSYAAPIPSNAPGIHPILIVSGLACLLLVDILAGTLHRVPLAGLPLLTIYSVPASLLGGGVSWWVFSLTAAGFLTMLFLQENQRVSRWGRTLGEDPAATDPSGFGVSTGAIRHSAGSIGAAATALAVFVPLLIPTLSLSVFDIGNGPGGDSDITITNPMTDLKRDLTQRPDVPVIRFTTEDPDPEYLRISVLNRFSDNAWTSGDRDVPTGNLADGVLPELSGVAPSVTRTQYDYEMTVLPNFDSTWLPTQAPISRIQARGDWRYDESTMDFIAGDSDLTTAGLTYSMTAVDLGLSAESMARTTASSNVVGKAYTELPPGLPTLVRSITNDVTRNAPTRYEKAVALQTWFRDTGGFTYDTSVSAGNGTDELVSFLSEGEDGRVGYCEQFASSMAVMARMLSIPARVAVGFLEPTQVGPDLWEYSSRDLHAWPELFFPGSGWVRFEPTPADRAEQVPDYTNQEVVTGNPTARPGNPRASEELPDRGASSEASPAVPDSSTDGGVGSSIPWRWVLGGLAGAGSLLLLLLAPRAVRGTRRQHRLSGGPESVWAELRATAVDLAVPWPDGRSPREIRDVLVTSFGDPAAAEDVERPRHGATLAPDAVEALDRIVLALELARYSRHPATTGELRDALELCVSALRAGASRATQRRAEWWPRSVMSRSRSATRRVVSAPVQVRHGQIVDHVG